MSGRVIMTSMRMSPSSLLAVIVSPLAVAFQPSGNVMDATGLSVGILTVSEKAGAANESTSRSEASVVFMTVYGVARGDRFAKCNLGMTRKDIGTAARRILR